LFSRADAAEQLEQSRLEMATFQQLKITETAAIPRRLETLTQDVAQQTNREQGLQNKYREALFRLKEASLGRFPTEEEVAAEVRIPGGASSETLTLLQFLLFSLFSSVFCVFAVTLLLNREGNTSM
jgi:hypothetical protein